MIDSLHGDRITTEHTSFTVTPPLNVMSTPNLSNIPADLSVSLYQFFQATFSVICGNGNYI
jgi:hypothetical protein